MHLLVNLPSYSRSISIKFIQLMMVSANKWLAITGLKFVVNMYIVRLNGFHFTSFGWIMGCFGFKGPVRQYFSLFWEGTQ